jgi:NAD(P)-dependent dehydrogenase (short-subunit alcohol dehydrogenase family)
MRTWFITGASRGFGALIAQEALEKGDAVVATARDPKSVTKRLGNHPNLLAVALDVTQEAQAHAAAKAAVERFGRIDILVNNAGYGLLGAVEEASAEEIEAVYRTNVFGLLAVTRAVLPHMRQQRSGRVLNISSVGGYRGFAGWGIYCSTKFAVEGLSEALAQELAHWECTSRRSNRDISAPTSSTSRPCRPFPRSSTTTTRAPVPCATAQ